MSQQPVQEINYKETLNLPVTSFPMKAGAATREPEIEAFWEEQRVYHTAQSNRDKKNKFVLHDGPPYLSSDKIHIGTALNKILKDIVTRYKYQRGYYAPYVPGYDGHGLPIENAVVKNLKGGRASVSPAELRRLCREFGLKNLKGQETNFKRLGVWGHWEKPYVTTDAEFEAIQIKLFGQMYEKGFVYKGLKPVYWCPTCETALADAEVEYADHQSHSVYVKFPVKNIPTVFSRAGRSEEELAKDFTEKMKALENASFVIWTTTPWTLPANLALSVHPEFEYVVIETTQGKLIVAEELLESFSNATGIKADKVLTKFKGYRCELSTAKHPFINREVPVLTGQHVTLDAGTGIVHTAPGHGMDDYNVCAEHDRKHPESKIGIIAPLNNRGVFTDEALVPQLTGVHYEKGNDIVLEILKEKNALLGHSKYDHSYPHCWRCHKPVIYRATEQWFIGVDKFRQDALNAINTVTWIPEKGITRITSMVENRTDWCISRQRVWGVPIPVFYCADEQCHTELLTQETTEKVYALFKEHSSDIWWEKSADEILQGSISCQKCGGKKFDKEMDIMDVWFDSGITHTAVVDARKEELGELPVELYLEGSDQHRGWFQSALLTSVMLSGKAPYKEVLTHGFVLDEKGEKMSKSKGNVVDPNTVMTQYGADILRLWVASVDYTVDIRIGNTILAQLAETYKKVRNTFRFLLGNLADFNPATDKISYENLSALDRYTLHRLQGLVERITRDFDQYEFHRYNHEIQWFCANDLSALYLDIGKDILYCDAKNSPRRRGIQTVLYETIVTLLPLLVPIMPHLAEDIWQNLPETQKPDFGLEKPPVSVTMAGWPQVNPKFVMGDKAGDFEQLLKIRDAANDALEKARKDGKIGSSLEAVVLLDAQDDKSKNFVATYAASELAALFITSDVQRAEDVSLSDAMWQTQSSFNGDYTFNLHAIGASADKCQRCWRFEKTVGQFAQHPSLCERCHQAVTSN